MAFEIDVDIFKAVLSPLTAAKTTNASPKNKWKVIASQDSLEVQLPIKKKVPRKSNCE
jgi:hypothetical protein